ncbi:MAG: class I SAM-dependent methyltransferase [Thermoplasmata archaeon]|nr:class I SAM-dependent methyltransferase [Thermoplasmata archaeon]MCI4338120.1 class I SAM-dependent methyltransferase [Thermoplasmata archaeon]
MPVAAVAAQGFTSAVGAYDRSRPGYSDAVVQRLFGELGLSRSSRILELAAGTGKFTRALVAAGVRPIAVEPLRRFSAPLRASFPGVPLVAALAESLPFADHRFDAVMAAQAFHWFDPERALCEIHRVLRADGGLALLWNQRDDAHPLHANMSRLLEEVDPGVPRHRTGQWRKALERSRGFSALSDFRIPFELEMDLEGVVDRVASVSFVAALPEERRTALLAQVREAGLEDPELRRRGRVRLPYQTEVYWARTLPADGYAARTSQPPR